MSYFIKNPVVILGCPRSGTSLLYTILSESEHLHSLYRESQDIFDSFYRIQAKKLRIYDNDTLTSEDLTDEIREFFLNEFHKYTLNTRPLGYIMREYLLKNDLLDGFASLVTRVNLLYKKALVKGYRIIEKNPRDCFRIPFVNKLFPDCRFIYIKRDGRSNISSLMEGWKRSTDYKRVPRPAVSLNIKGDQYGKWRYILPPDWESYINKPLEEVCAFQWLSANKTVVENLKNIGEERKLTISYEELTSDTPTVVKKICDFIDIPYSKGIENFAEKPPVVSTPKTENPKEDKWKKNEKLLENIYPMISPMMKELGYKLEKKEPVSV